MNAEKIAEQTINSMGSQMDLLFTLSVAICGGIIVLLVQIALHNSGAGNKIKLNSTSLLIVTFIFEGMSILLGYFARGSITSSIPQIYKLDYAKINSFGSAVFDAHCMLKSLFLLQFFTFFIGIILLFFLVWNNKDLVAVNGGNV
jgi:hypothetical protein